MELVHSHKTSSYSFILTEDEWYLGSEQQKQAWVNQIMREGAEAKCNNINILVRPDGVMSVSPVSHTHSVYCHVVRQHEAHPDKVRAIIREWAHTIPNGPYVGELEGMARSMSDRELLALKRAFEKYFG